MPYQGASKSPHSRSELCSDLTGREAGPTGQTGLRALAIQCGIGAGKGLTAYSVKPAASSQPPSSADENTQPVFAVNAMLTANSAENLGAVWVGSVIMSITYTEPPGTIDS